MNTRKITALAAAGVLALAGLAGCSTNEGAKTDGAKTASTAAAPSASSPESEEKGAVAVNARPKECGLAEQSGPEGSVGPFDIALHYFQPGIMGQNPETKMKMVGYHDAQMHLELDTKANEYATNWGYAVDETPADLRISYRIADSSDKVLSEGMMMEMNAIDGSHYGLNLPKDTIKGPGTYKLTITIYPPADYALHQDYITGVPAKEWFKPLTITMPWEIKQENLDTIAKNTVANPEQIPDNCKSYPVKMFKDPAAEEAMKKAEQETPLPLLGHTKMG